ncbi:MAG: alpha/beta hydrolase [Gammaproteobacteria bacterium AqS3]|nr:alpha/beta hydrolase [Gammaproteobacteria bacterium AqS3]
MQPDWFTQAVQTRPQEHQIDIPGGRTWCSYWPAEVESDELLVLVHGTGAHRCWWDFISPLLSGEQHVLAGDLSGMGDADHQDDYGTEKFAGEVLEWISLGRRLSGARRVRLLGHSMGGFVCMWVAQKQPDLLDSLIVVDSPIRPPDYDYENHISSAPIRRRKVYPDRASALQRFRLTPTQECENRFIIDYIAERSIAQVDAWGRRVDDVARGDGGGADEGEGEHLGESGFTWKFDDGLMGKVMRHERDRIKPPAELRPLMHYVYGNLSVLVEGGVLAHVENLLPAGRVIAIEDAAHHVFLDKPLEFVDLVRRLLQADREASAAGDAPAAAEIAD